LQVDEVPNLQHPIQQEHDARNKVGEQLLQANSGIFGIKTIFRMTVLR